MNIGNSYQIITQKEHDIQGISDLEPFIIGLFKLIIEPNYLKLEKLPHLFSNCEIQVKS